MVTTAAPAAPPLVRMSGIGMRFGSAAVLRDVGLTLHAGELHVLAGENGAGKSTLIRILAGLHPGHTGTIELDGRPVRPASPRAASELGIAVIHQELSLIPSMTVADNLLLDRLPSRGGFVSTARLRGQARTILARLAVPAEPDDLVDDLPLGVRQQVEIAKAFDRKARLLILDEPTSALTRPEAERLFHLLDGLKRDGCALVYITHRMEEIQRLADRITVLRDGAVAGTGPASEMPPDRLVHLMVGRDIGAFHHRAAPPPGPEVLHVEDFHVDSEVSGSAPAVSGAGFTLRAGEILGLAGLQGSGASELLAGLFGAYGDRAGGRLRVAGKAVRIGSPAEAIRHGLALLTNDRKETGLVSPLSVTANTTLAALSRFSPGGWRSDTLEARAARGQADALNLRAASLEAPVWTLSGGNQQKVVLGKWLETRPRILLLDEPTRGIDVGAKQDIYDRMNRWTREGMAILLITSELPELLGMSDRLLVLHRGRVTARLERGEATPERVMAAAMGEVMQESRTSEKDESP